MKTRYILYLFLSAMLTMPSAEAQLLKKIKNKVSKVTGSKEKNETESEDTEAEKNSESGNSNKEENQINNSHIGMPFGGGLEGVPDTYQFSYILTYEINSQKESMPIHYLLEPNMAYFGNKMDDQRANQTIVYDLKRNIMVTFMDNDQQKIAMKMRMPDNNKYMKKVIPEDEEDIQIVPIEGKNILGYECNGFQTTSKDGIAKFWITNDAPVSLNGVLGNFSSLPKSAKDMALPLNEKSLIMEMTYTDHKKKKNNMHMVCTELKKDPLEIHKKDYKSGM